MGRSRALESVAMLVRHLTAILVLPGTVAVFVPVWIARSTHIAWAAPDNPTAVLAVLCGTALAVVGLMLFSASVFSFWARGRGTLAPWDPPRAFVVDGPYRFVRNPMISGVMFLLCAEACILRSAPHAEWAAIVAAVNAIYIPALEEPTLVARFGEPYLQYQRAVRRFLPRVRPWTTGVHR